MDEFDLFLISDELLENIDEIKNRCGRIRYGSVLNVEVDVKCDHEFGEEPNYFFDLIGGSLFLEMFELGLDKFKHDHIFIYNDEI